MDPMFMVLIVCCFTPVASMLGGYLLFGWKHAPVILFTAAAAVLIGGLVQWNSLEPERRMFLLLPFLCTFGLASGSVVRLGELQQKEEKKKNALYWQQVASATEGGAQLYIYVQSEEHAGDCFSRSGDQEEALKCYRRAWSTVTAVYGVHVAMTPLGQKLANAYRACGKIDKAQAIELKLEQASKDWDEELAHA